MTSAVLIQPGTAHAPEITALNAYVNAQPGMSSRVVSSEHEIDVGTDDVVYRMMGLAPRWRQASLPEIHDYASLSTGTGRRLKDVTKVVVNRRPVLRTFLNDYVRGRLPFRDDVPGTIRDMAVPVEFGQARRPSTGTPADFEFDLVYVGSLSATRELAAMIDCAVREGLRLLLVGDPSNELHGQVAGARGIEMAGRVAHSQIPEVCSRAWAGASHVPPRQPYGRQTATKVLEYCALGMPVVTNRTAWARRYEEESGARFRWTDDWTDVTRASLTDDDIHPPSGAVVTWPQTFERAGILTALRSADR